MNTPDVQSKSSVHALHLPGLAKDFVFTAGLFIVYDRLVERRERYDISYVTVSDSNLDAFAPVVDRLAGS